MGIDPGTQLLGYGVLEKTKNGLLLRDKGTLRSKSHSTFSERLFSMAQQVSSLFEKWKPETCAIEKIFLGRNVDSAFKLGHIRGICMHQAMLCGASFHEYTPRSVKQGITGSGAASKEQVQMLLYSQLGLPANPSTMAKEYDASDALALAFYHGMRIDLQKRFQGTGINI